MAKLIKIIAFMLAVIIANSVAKSLVKMPLVTDDNNKFVESTVTVQTIIAREKINNAAETEHFDEREHAEGVQVTVRVLPKENGKNAPLNTESDRDLLAPAPIAKPIQMTLIARQQPQRQLEEKDSKLSPTASITQTIMNHQQPPRRNTPTPPRHSPDSREMVASLVGVNIDEHSEDPFQ